MIEADEREGAEGASDEEKLDIKAEKDTEAQERILYYTYGGMAMGLVPFPLLDLAALTALQLKMLHRLSGIYGVEFKANLGRSASTSLVGGLAPVASAAPVAASLSKFIPGVGHVLSYGTLVALNGASTYAVGQVFARHFSSGGTFFTFDPETTRDYFTEQYEKGKGVVNSTGP
ncbi:YcjF family protein [Candidatus Electrothrix sp.]|uniref:YcjF family protein n=1 Tax=Candidatus Electrothrix sp. TaxID=2170559 RepID=UPI0040561952